MGGTATTPAAEVVITPFRHVSDEPFAHDVANRIPDSSKARQLLDFEATTTLDTMLDEVIPWIRQGIADGRR